MGQLEKYGLYVLCLVIFLILGVTIWGGGELPPTAKRTGPGPSTELNANARNATSNPAGGGSTAVRPNNTTPPSDVLSLLQPVPPPADPTKKGEAKPVDATAPKTGGDAAKNAVDPTKSNVKPAVAELPRPADASRPSHKVARGETFDSIAKDKLGSAALRTEIARLNPRVDPGKLQVGQDLVLPSATEVAAITAKAKPKTSAAPKTTAAPDADASVEKKGAADAGTYTIAKGDTFELIARRELGSSKRVNELRELNSDIDPTRLRIGMQIKLPKK